MTFDSRLSVDEINTKRTSMPTYRNLATLFIGLSLALTSAPIEADEAMDARHIIDAATIAVERVRLRRCDGGFACSREPTHTVLVDRSAECLNTGRLTENVRPLSRSTSLSRWRRRALRH